MLVNEKIFKVIHDITIYGIPVYLFVYSLSMGCIIKADDFIYKLSFYVHLQKIYISIDLIEIHESSPYTRKLRVTKLFAFLCKGLKIFQS